MIWSIKLRGLCIVGYGFNLCFLGHFIGEMGGLLNKTCVVFGNYINYRYLCRHLGLENYNSIVNFYIFYPIKLVRRIQLASATPSKLNEKARWYSPLAFHPTKD